MAKMHQICFRLELHLSARAHWGSLHRSPRLSTWIHSSDVCVLIWHHLVWKRSLLIHSVIVFNCRTLMEEEVIYFFVNCNIILLLGDWCILFCWLGQASCTASIFWHRREFCLQVATNMSSLCMGWAATWWKYTPLCSVVSVSRLLADINWWRVCHPLFYCFELTVGDFSQSYWLAQ